MLQTTIQDLLGGSVDATGYRVYVVKNESEVLYVGQSSNIRDRLRGHIATRGELEGSLLGKAIFENTPQSQAWEVDLYTIEDCTDLIQHYSLTRPGRVTMCMPPRQGQWEISRKMR